MRSLTKTGIRMLSAKYRSILIKCAIINASMFIGAFGASSAFADDVYVSSWMGLQGAVAGDANPIYVNGNITRGASDGDITISRTLSIIGTETGKYLSGADTYKGLAIASDTKLNLENITMQNFKSTADGSANYNEGNLIINGSTFTGNTATDNGGAIYNTKGAKTNIIADDRDITFNGNYLTSECGQSGAIYNDQGTVGLYADDGKTITFAGGANGNTNNKYGIDGIMNDDILNINGDDTGTTYTGTVNLYTVNTENITGETNIYGGTVGIKDYFEQGTLDVKNGATLDLAKGQINQVIADTLNIEDGAKLKLDVGNNAIDSLSYTSNESAISVAVNEINLIGDIDAGILTWLSGTGGTFTDNTTGLLAGATKNAVYTFTKNSDGVLKVEKGTAVSLPELINHPGYENVTSYALTDTDETMDANLGTLNGTNRNFTINGNGHTLNGQKSDTENVAGITVLSGQTLTLNNVNMQNFKNGDNGGAISNGDTFNKGGTITDITGNFSENSAKNGGAIHNRAGVIGSITSIFEKNSATTNGGAIYNFKQEIGGTIDSLTGNFIKNSAAAGGAIYNISGGEIGNITGDFEGNYATNSGGAINNGAKIGNITGNFKGNHADSTGGMGGAIYNSGTIENITGDFENNYTASNNGGGAIANVGTASIFTSGDKSTISFKGNYITNSTGKGGAIWNIGTVGLYAVNAGDKIEFTGTTPTDIPAGVTPEDIDGICNTTLLTREGVLNINGYVPTGATSPVTYAGTVNLQNVTGTGTTNIYGGNVSVAKDLTQKTVSIAENATLTTNGNITTTDGIANANILNLLGGSKNTETGVITRAVINSTVSGDGTTNFGTADSKAYIQTTTDKAIAQAINLVNADVIANSALGASGKGFNISDTSTLTIAANNIMADVANSGTLNLGTGTLSSAITGDGSIITTGDVSSIASYLGNAVTNTGHTLTLTGDATTGVLSKAIGGNGTTVIDGIVTSSDTIAQDALTINEYKTLTASVDKLNITTALTNNGTLVTDGNLNNLTTLTNNGTVKIAENKTLNVTGTKNLGGTLDLNGQELNMQEAGGDTPVYSTLTVNTLKGTGNLLIDANVNETNKNADKIAYSAVDNAVINLTNVNVKEGFTTHTTDAKDDHLTVLNGSGATFKVGGDTGKTSTQFGDYLYTFETGTTEGTLKVTEKFNGTVSLADYITGTEKGRIIDTYSFANNETLIEAIITGSVSDEKNPYTIGMNGKNLTGSNTDGITISTEKTLTVYGNGGTISGFNTALINEGTLNLENVVFSGNTTDVSNAGTLNLTGENTFGSKITGETGTVTNSGTLNVDAANLDVVLTNNNSLNLGAGTLGKAVTGSGTTNINDGIVIANGNFTQSKLNLESAEFSANKDLNVDNLSMTDSTLGLQNGSTGVLNVNTLALAGNNHLTLDADLANETMDQLNVTSVSGNGNIVISDIKLLAPTTKDKISLDLFADEDTKTALTGKVTGNLTGLEYSPIYKYDALYDSATGKIGFTRYNSGTSDDFNPYIYAPSVVANTTATMTTQIAALAMDKMDNVVNTQGRSGGDAPSSSNVWVKVMGLNDNVEFNNFENIDSKALTVAGGYNTDKISCGDCGIVFGAYAGYIGGKQQYTDNDIDQNGGYVGLSSALTLGDAFLTATVNGGLLNNKANNMYGSDRFNTRWLGVGLKTGYNYAITDSVVLQPNVYGGYTLVNTQDYTSVSGVKIATNNLNFFEIDPGLKLSAVIADGWTGSVQGKYAIVMDNGADITANYIALQNISSKNYFEYGIGIDKSVTDAFYLGAKINRHDGGRTGWNGSIEFKYKF